MSDLLATHVHLFKPSPKGDARTLLLLHGTGGTPPDHRDGHEELFGIQAWVALPRHDEERDPDVSHQGTGGPPVGPRGRVPRPR